MMQIRKIYLSLLTLAVLFSGCESLLDTDSDRKVFPDQHQLNSPNDTLYSLVGIFSKLEKIADRYVLLGELRGDLMDITEQANPHLREIYNFQVSPENPYNEVADYYAIINNCNYLIQTIDTSITVGVDQVMYKEFAAAKAIRAWTYMQIVLNYGEVKYYEHPILYLKDTNTYTPYTINELVPVLIQDLAPWRYIEEPEGISLGTNISSETSFFPILFVLGDLYLWNGDYESAAMAYHELMHLDYIRVLSFFKSTWTVENGVFVERKLLDQSWRFVFHLGNNQLTTVIAGSKEYGQGSYLDSITWFNPEIVPSETAINYWNKQTYYDDAEVYTNGDLRGDIGSYFSNELFGNFTSTYFNNRIAKYLILNNEEESKAVSIYRPALLYLRYAEAVNRAGKPNLAFAVLKHGMSSETLEVDTIVPRSEKYISFTDTTGVFYDYINFESILFDYNIGIHARGCGNTDLATDYIIPALGSLQDSILYVENLIVEELALETAFEGNRFHDLMRVSMRRNNPGYLANLVSDKYKADKEAIRTKLMDENNWYLP